MSRRLLLVSYYFPPIAGPGVFRPLRFAKHLPRLDWEVSVLTVSARARLLKDPQLEGEVPASVSVRRTMSLEPRLPLIALNRLGLGRLVRRLAPWLRLPDDQRGWVWPAVRAGRRLLDDARHDAILSTSSPYSAHLVGRALRRHSGLPWLADFRDEWTTNPYIDYPARWVERLNRRLEREVLGEADRVVCVSRPWLDALQAQVPHEAADKFRVLENGFDADHFAGRRPARPDRFRVVYTGTFYGHRSPEVFFEGARRALERGTVRREELEIVLVGHTADAAGLGEGNDLPLTVVEHRPYREALDLLCSAAALLLVVPPEGGAGNHTGKLFPYLASGRPILALAPEGNVAGELVRQSGAGIVVAPDDAGGVAAALERLYRDWRDGESTAGRDEALIESFEARPQAEALVSILNELVR